MANSERVIIDVDADAAADVPPSRIVRGNGDAAAPFEVASSDSEDDNPPTKRPKPAPVSPVPAGNASRAGDDDARRQGAPPASPPGNALLAQLRREREAKRGPWASSTSSGRTSCTSASEHDGAV